MEIIFDIILMALLAISIFLGYKKGLVKVVISLFALIIAIVVTLVFYRPVSQAIINNTDWDEKIEKVIIDNTSKKIEENEENKNLIDNLQNYVEDSINKTQNEIVEKSAKLVSEKVITVGTIIGLFIVTRLLLLLLTLLSDLITNLPIIKQFNEIGGLLYGLIRGILLIYVILAIIYFIVSISANTGITNIIDKTFITKYMYTNNILLNIIF